MLRKMILVPLLITVGLMIAFQNCAPTQYQKGFNSDAYSLETKHFYLIEENYTCQTMAGDTIETYRDSLYFFDGNVCFSGNGCNDSVTCVPWPEDLEVSMDRLHVNFKGQVYYFMDTPPFE